MLGKLYLINFTDIETAEDAEKILDNTGVNAMIAQSNLAFENKQDRNRAAEILRSEGMTIPIKALRQTKGKVYYGVKSLQRLGVMGI